MIQRAGRMLFGLICAAMLLYGLRYERHEVRALEGESEQMISGPGFVEGATVDGYMLQDGQLYDVYSLSGATAQEKDCKT